MARLLLLRLRLDISQLVGRRIWCRLLNHHRHFDDDRLYHLFLSKVIGYVQRQFRGTEVIVGAAMDEVATPLILIAVVSESDIPYPNGSLQAPAVAESPGIAQRQTTSDEPALVAVVLQPLHHAEGHIDTTHIELSAKGMDTSKPPKQIGSFLLLEPIAVFWHQRPVAPFLSVREFPRVNAVKSLEGRARADFHLQTDVGR